MHPIVTLGFFFVVIGYVTGVNIVQLSVPRVVQANTTAVVLDCDYTVDEWERDGLVVKWNLDSVHLVYQWIPPYSPQALGALNGRVNTTYEASRHLWAKHRAIYIPNPDPSLSGRYFCTVSTFEDEDTRSAEMLVWTPAKVLNLRYWRPSKHDVQVTCSAQEIYPRPVFYLYTKHANGSRQEVHVRWRTATRHHGLLNAEASGLISWADTKPDTIIGCTLTLPGTPHAQTLRKLYTPDLPIITTTTTTTTTTPRPTTKSGRRAKGWSEMSQHVPNTTNNYFGFTDMFGAANRGNKIESGISPASLYLCSLMCWSWWTVYQARGGEQL